MAINDPLAWYCPTLTGDVSDYTGTQADLLLLSSSTAGVPPVENGTYAPTLNASSTNPFGSTSSLHFDYLSNAYAGVAEFTPVVQPSGDFALSFFGSTFGWKNFLVYGGDLPVVGTASDPFTIGAASQSGTQSLPAFDWFHFALSYDSASGLLTTWANGIQDIGPLSVSLPARSTRIRLGTTIDLDGFALYGGFQGELDDFRLFDHVLTQGDVTTLASGVGATEEIAVAIDDPIAWYCPTLTGDMSDHTGTQADLELVSNDSPGVETLNGTYAPAVVTSPANSAGSTQSIRFEAVVGSYAGNADFTPVAQPSGDFAISFWGSAIDLKNFLWWGPDGLWFVGESANASPAWGISNAGNLGTGTVSYDDWFHFTYSYNSTTGEYTTYLNGVLDSGPRQQDVDGSLGPLPPRTERIRIGTVADIVGFQSYAAFNGYMDDFRLFDHALDQEAATALASGVGATGDSGGGGTDPVGLGDEQLWLCPSLNDSADDISGNGNDGTYQGGMGTVADSDEGGSYAFDFDGVDDYIQTSLTDTSWRSGGTFSVSGWYKSGNKYGYAAVLSDGEVDLGQTSNFNRGRAGGLAPNGQLTFAATPYSNSGSDWLHFAMVVDSGAMDVYEDGVHQGSFAAGYGTTVNAQLHDARIGVNPVDGLPYSQCRVDDIRAYSRTLTQAEITHLATSRGIEGGPDAGGGGSNGLGDELLWISPSLDADKLDSPNLDDLSSNAVPLNANDTDGVAVWTPNTDSGGSYLISGDDSSRDVLDVFPSPTGKYVTVSLWMDVPVVTNTKDGAVFNIGSSDFNTGSILTANFKQNVFAYVGSRLRARLRSGGPFYISPFWNIQLCRSNERAVAVHEWSL